MRTFLFLAALVAAATAALTPPHILITPQEYHVDTNVNFTLTNYAEDSFQVTAMLTYDTCSQRRISIIPLPTEENNVYSQDTQVAVQDRPTILNIKMPSLDEIAERRYYIEIKSDDGENVFLSRRPVSFNFGFILIKTDKPIYKPSQTVNVCTVYLDSSLRPHSVDTKVQVRIRDAKYRQIFKTTVTVEAGDGVNCFDFKLSEEPSLGQYYINANLKIEDACGYYYSKPYSNCNFKVDEFVLPKFEVTLEAPKQITRTDNYIEGTVTAKYTFGEYVQGSVRINATLEAVGRRESIVFFDTIDKFEDGKFNFNISAYEYQRQVQYRYDPFCVSSSLRLVAEVTEAGRKLNQSASAVLPLVANPVSVSFHDNNPTVFRPGLPYTIRGKASLADGSAASDVTVLLSATANNGQKSLLEKEEILTDSSGFFSRRIEIPDDINCLKFTLSPSQQERSCERQSVCFSPSPMYSPSNSFLQLTDTTATSPLRPGDVVNIIAEATFPFKTLHLVVVGQGNIQLHQASVDVKRESVRSLNVSVPVSPASVPQMTLLGVVARDDGELVADVIDIEVACELEHKVDVSYSRSVASPGEALSITTRASPNSLVVLGVTDKSLTLLADACKSVEDSNVCKLLRTLMRGYQPSSASCSAEVESSCCPSSCNEPTKRSVTDIFRAAGLSFTTNMFQPEPPYTYRPTQPPYYYDDFFFRPEFGGPAVESAPPPLAVQPQPGRPSVPVVAPTAGIPDETEPETEDGGDDSVRDFFPETLLFEIFRTNSSGVAVTESVVPDTITTFNAEAFAVSEKSGLGLSPLAELIVKKDLFVSLELPYSITFGESITVIPLVFHFGEESSLLVRVEVTVDQDLDLVETDLTSSGLVLIKKGTGTPFSMKLRPRAIGYLPVTICVRQSFGRGQAFDESQPCVDTVRKNLFVKPGCERFQITNTVLASESGESCFNYTLPSCVIPGSASARITVTGDVMTPPDLDRLLVLPYGCGEQNMVRFSLNLVVGVYMASTAQLPDFLSVKIRNNLQTGYQRQLNFLDSQGCFSIFPGGGCSLFLTSFTAKYLIQTTDPALSPALGLSEESELVDAEVIRGAVGYLISQQEKSGKFPVIGRLHNSYLMRRDDYVGLTAMTLLTLKSANATAPESDRTLEESTERGVGYIQERYKNGSTFCNYGLALSVDALTYKESSPRPRIVNRMLTDLKSRVQKSKLYSGACFICNECPGTEEEVQNSTECPSRPLGEGSASCVETTAYALHALLNVGDQSSTVCLAQYLTQIRKASGGFYSSQDTLVALSALSRLAKKTFTTSLDKNLTFSLPTLTSSHSVHVTPDNRFEVETVQVPTVPSSDNCVQYSGNGTVIIQSTVEYYGCSCCDNSQSFSLYLSAVKLGKDAVELSIDVRYEGQGTSNMAIVDVGIPSGYSYTGYTASTGNDTIQREEVRGDNAIFYLNEIDSTRFVVSFKESFSVENPQQVPVTVYDYYNPDQIVTEYYLPVSTSALFVRDGRSG